MPRPVFSVLPPGLLPILREIARILLRRPLVGIAAVARRADGRILLVKRGDTGTWALPGGTLEWGEVSAETLRRELREEAGATMLEAGRLLGVYTAPERDTRLHGVTIVVECTVADELDGPKNPIEIHDACFFSTDEVPRPLAFSFDEVLDRALSGAAPFWE